MGGNGLLAVFVCLCLSVCLCGGGELVFDFVQPSNRSAHSVSRTSGTCLSLRSDRHATSGTWALVWIAARRRNYMEDGLRLRKAAAHVYTYPYLNPILLSGTRWDSALDPNIAHQCLNPHGAFALA